MCGIATIVANGKPIDSAAIGRMVAALRHRGPDEQAQQELPGCHLGHTRLSIIDLEGGHQPMSDPEGRYWIVFNGEIYNYRELRVELAREGWTFRTSSDTEVLLRAYQAWGADVVRRINGQFAFAIWDNQSGELFAARDRLGEKPLYFATSADGLFLLASEIKGLLASNMLAPKIDPVAVDAYLGLLYVPPDRTIYRNVSVLPPGHFMHVRAGQVTRSRYWEPRFGAGAERESWTDVVAHTRSLIEQAVRRQMVADVPVGAFLSGGLDSSTIVALMSRVTSRPVKTFSVGFGNLINELPYARIVADRYGTEHHAIQMDIPVGNALEQLAAVYDEPLADSSNIPTSMVAEFARRQVKVVLSGDGGDELFGGYEWYRPLLASLDINASAGPAALALFLRALCRAGLPLAGPRDRVLVRRQGAAMASSHTDPWDRHLACATEWGADHSAWWGPGNAPAGAAMTREAWRPAAVMEGMDRASAFDLSCYLPGDILMKVDRAAMAHSLETRAPFLDVDLIEYVLSIPWRLRFATGADKSLLRAACADLWPPDVQRRGKQGFGAPLRSWVRRPDVRTLSERVFVRSGPLTALLPGLRLVQPAQLSPQRHWTLLCLGLWLESRTGCLCGCVKG